MGARKERGDCSFWKRGALTEKEAADWNLGEPQPK